MKVNGGETIFDLKVFNATCNNPGTTPRASPDPCRSVNEGGIPYLFNFSLDLHSFSSTSLVSGPNTALMSAVLSRKHAMTQNFRDDTQPRSHSHSTSGVQSGSIFLQRGRGRPLPPLGFSQLRANRKLDRDSGGPIKWKTANHRVVGGVF